MSTVAETLARAQAYHQAGQLRDAEQFYRRVLELRPDFAEVHNELGIALSAQGEFDQAIACCRRAFELKPDFVEAHINRGKVLLQLGQFAEGWLEYEWRWQRLYRPPRTQPAWDGSAVAGRTLLIYAEQGLGDTLQFIRYVPLLESQGAQVIVEAQRPLVALLAQSGFSRVVPQGAPLPSYDVHAALMSLPSLFKTTLASVPARVPYLSANAALREHWRQRLNAVVGLKVGIVWQVSQDTAQPWRAIPLSAFERVARLAGVRLVSLQKGLGREEIAGTADRFSLVDFGPQLDEASGPFMDTAALMTQLDLVITSDTATAHLAGGLGVPVWVALPYLACWRWMRTRTDSPWYPTMRLFRQERPGDWDGVFQRIEKELAKLV